MGIPPAEEESLPLAVRILFSLLRRRGEGIPPALRVYARRPSILFAFLLLGRAVRRPGKLPERLKRLAMFHAASLVACPR